MTGEPWVLAIDFGTSFTVAASRIGDRPAEVIEIDGERRLPSVIMIDDDGSVVVGKAAENLASTNPGRVLRAPKSRLGEPAPVVLGGRPHPITGLVADLLGYVYREAVRYHGREPDEVRLTHPATWSGPRRQQLLAAAELAGLSGTVLVPEPVAAAIAYADEGSVPEGGHVLVYDLGGGTFDTAALQASPDGFVVVGRPGGDPRLGGELFDELLANRIGERLDGDAYERIQLAEDALWQQAAVGLLRESRRVKEALSSHPFAEVLLGLPTGLVQQRVSQDDLYRVIGPYVDESVDVMRQTTLGAGLDAGDLSSIYLVGGASRTPLVEESVASAFPEVPISRRGDPKGVVAVGATHPRATPTSLAQRSSLDRASTLERPGPPPPAAPIVIEQTPAPSVEAAATTDLAALAAPVGTVIDDGTVVDSTVIDSGTVVDRTVVDRTVIDGGGSLAPPGDGPATAAMPSVPVPPPSKRPDRRIVALVAAAAALLLIAIGGIVLAGRGGDGEQAEPTQPDDTSTPAGPGLDIDPPGPVESTPSSITLPPPDTISATTAPPTPAPTPPPTPAPTPPPTPAGPTVATDADLIAALVTLDDLTAGQWNEIAPDDSPHACGTTAAEGVVAQQSKLFQSATKPGLGIGHTLTAYSTPELAQADFAASVALFAACDATTTLQGYTYDVSADIQTFAEAGVAVDQLPCADDGQLIVVGYSSADSPIPFIFETYAAVRCGSNISLVGLLTTDPDDATSPDFLSAIGSAVLRVNNLPGSN